MFNPVSMAFMYYSFLSLGIIKEEEDDVSRKRRRNRNKNKNNGNIKFTRKKNKHLNKPYIYTSPGLTNFISVEENGETD